MGFTRDGCPTTPKFFFFFLITRNTQVLRYFEIVRDLNEQDGVFGDKERGSWKKEIT